MEIFYYFKLYLIITGIILIGYYLIPAGFAYVLFYKMRREKWKKMRIQERYPKSKSIRREIKWSVITVFILGALTTVLYYFVQLDVTKMYFNIGEHGWLYFFLSAVILIISFDTYFYWMHRFMHLKWVFPWVHRTHHLSHTPTPWAILAFGPLEAIIEFGIYPVMVFLMPLHPVAIGIFALHNIILNTGGHIGYEVIPRSFFHHPLLKYGLTVTHHEMHHSKVNCNYGIYFNIWDRIMHTNHRDYEKTYMKVKDKLSSK